MQLTKIQNSDDGSPGKDGEGVSLEHKNIVVNEPIEQTYQLWLRALFGVIGLAVYLVWFKKMYDGDASELRIWEDLYGRSLFFFICSVAWYLFHARRN